MGTEDDNQPSLPVILNGIMTRRRLLASGFAFAALVSLGACGGDDDDDSDSEATAATESRDEAEPSETEDATESAEETEAAEETQTTEATESASEAASTSEDDAGAGFPRTVTHALGETVIPARPERIVSTYDNEPLDVVLALGMKPVLYGYTGGYEIGRASSWAEEIGIDGIDTFDFATQTELDLEAIAAASPDLIIGMWTEPAVYDQLSGIAPTIILKVDEVTPWDYMQRMAGEALGLEEKAEEVIAETEQVIADQEAKLASYSEMSVAIAYEFQGSLLINGGEAAIGWMVEQFGLSVLAPDPAIISSVSLEQWQTVQDADIILTPEFFADDVAKQEENSLFRGLPQIAAGHYVVLPSEVSQSLYLESALSVRWGASRLADVLLAGAEGNGKTLEG